MMKSISNIKIGRKIGLMLAGNLVFLVGISVLAQWGLRTAERLAEDSIDRLTESRIAETISGETAAIGQAVGQNVGIVLLGAKPTEESENQIRELRRTRDAELEDFKARANTPESLKQAADMAERVQASTASDERLSTDLSSGRLAEAGQEFKVSPVLSAQLRAKAKEASRLQEELVKENEKKRRESARTTLVVLVTGSLLAAAGSMLGGLLIGRSIAKPLAATVSHLGEIAQGDLSKDVSSGIQGRGDEIGAMGRAMQTMISALRTMIHEVANGIQVLSSSSSTQKATAARKRSENRVRIVSVRR